MAIYKFPNDKDPKNEKKEYIHQPEYVILEEEGEGASNSQDQECLNTFHYLQRLRFSPLFRVLFFWAGIVTFALTCLFFLFSSVALALSLVTFHQIPSFQKTTIRFWNGCCRMAVFSLGLLAAAFSPVFGLGIIILYFLMIGESPRQNSFFVRIFKGQQ